MRTGTLVAAALCAVALSACGGGRGGSATIPAPPAGTAAPAPIFSTVPISSTSTQRGIPLTGDRLSVAVLADGTVAYSNRFDWGLVKASGALSTWSGSFDGGGPVAFGRGADGSLYAGNSVPAGNTLASSVLNEATGEQWSFSAFPPWVILGGPDGGTWVLTFTGMVRLDAGGTTTFLPVTAPPGDANDVTLGPDGAFWVAEFGGAIERVPLHGAPLRFPVDGHPQRIAAGADGALWFLDDAGLVRRMTTSGQTRTYFSVGGRFTEADAIAAGADGAMWLTNGGANELVRIAPDGAVTRFPAPAAGDSPSGIVAAPDGTLYFFEQNLHGLVVVHATPR